MKIVNNPRAIPCRAAQPATSRVISLISRGFVSIVSRSCATGIAGPPGLSCAAESRARRVALPPAGRGSLCYPRTGRSPVVMKTPAAIITLLASLAGIAVARAGTVDLLLVLAADVSRSIDDGDFNLQRKGYAPAMTHPG